MTTWKKKGEDRVFIGQYEKAWNVKFAGWVRQFHLISISGRRKTYKFSSPYAAKAAGWVKYVA